MKITFWAQHAKRTTYQMMIAQTERKRETQSTEEIGW